MMKRLTAIAGTCLVIAIAIGLGPQRLIAEGNGATPSPPMELKVGDTAPNFTLLAFDGTGLKKYSLEDYRGKKNVALAFYVFGFTGG
ncbi:MAG: hypothetical protein ACRD2U_12150 [Terriglobales bacterium]